MGEFADAIAAFGRDLCPRCNKPLGDTWMEEYDPSTDRLVKVHQAHQEGESR